MCIVYILLLGNKECKMQSQLYGRINKNQTLDAPTMVVRATSS